MLKSPCFTGPLCTQMAEEPQLGGTSERTHDGYLRAVRKLADFCQTAPDKITKAQLRLTGLSDGMISAFAHVGRFD